MKCSKHSTKFQDCVTGEISSYKRNDIAVLKTKLNVSSMKKMTLSLEQKLE